MRGAWILTLLLLPIAAMAAPVPTHLMPRVEVHLQHDSNLHPLGNSYEIILRNVGGAELQLWTDRPLGLATFLDVEIVNEKGERLSRFFPWSRPAKPGAAPTIREAIPAGKSVTTAQSLFDSLDDPVLQPGTYRVRVRFKYKDHDAASEWLKVEVSTVHIRTRLLVP